MGINFTKARTRLFAVNVHLRAKRLGALECFVIAQEINHIDADFLTIKIAVKIEQKCLQDGNAVIEARARAKIRRSIKAPLARMYAHRVYAVLQGKPVRHGYISSGKSKPGPPLVTANDLTRQPPPVAKVLRRAARIPLAQMLANAG